MDAQRALRVAAGTSAILALVKFGAGLATGSLVVLASAGDSFADAVMSTVNALGYEHARTPADEGHPYGHGKLEGALAVGQGMLLVGIVISLVATSAVALVQGREAPRIEWALAALAGSGLCAGALTALLARAARSDDSLVLATDSAHYTVDLLGAVAGIAGLLLVGATGWTWLDPALSLGFAGLMARESYGVLRRGAAEILDEALPAAEVEQVRAVLASNAARVVAFHGLRTRRSGPLRFIEVHADLDPELSMHAAHLLVQDIARQIREELPGSRVLVHPDAHGLADAVDQHLEEGVQA